MIEPQSTLDNSKTPPLAAVFADFDADVEHGEDILFLGIATVMMLPFFAPVAPPHILLPCVALCFALSASFARLHYQKMQHKLNVNLAGLAAHEAQLLQPLRKVFVENPMPELADSFNPLKNIHRTWKSALGALLINPFWFPIFYVLGMQIIEDKNFRLLNLAVIAVEKRLIRQGILPDPSLSTIQEKNF